MTVRVGAVVAAALTGAVFLAGSVATGAAEHGSRAPSRSCPRTVDEVKPTRNAKASSVLVPAGPSGLVLCRYNGLNNRPPMALARAVRIKRSVRIRDLEGQFDSLPVPPDGVTACPASDGSAIAAVFTYRHAARVTVVTQIGGCGDVNNGRLHRTSRYADDLIEQLKTLTHCESDVLGICKA